MIDGPFTNTYVGLQPPFVATGNFQEGRSGHCSWCQHFRCHSPQLPCSGFVSCFRVFLGPVFQARVHFCSPFTIGAHAFMNMHMLLHHSSSRRANARAGPCLLGSCFLKIRVSMSWLDDQCSEIFFSKENIIVGFVFLLMIDPCHKHVPYHVTL